MTQVPGGNVSCETGRTFVDTVQNSINLRVGPVYLYKAHDPITDKLLPPFSLVRLPRVNREALNAVCEARHVLHLVNLIICYD